MDILILNKLNQLKTKLGQFGVPIGGITTISNATDSVIEYPNGEKYIGNNVQIAKSELPLQLSSIIAGDFLQLTNLPDIGNIKYYLRIN